MSMAISHRCRIAVVTAFAIGFLFAGGPDRKRIVAVNEDNTHYFEQTASFMTEDARNLFLNAELFVHRPSGFSFPSGHSCAATAFLTVMFAKNKAIGWVFLLPVLLMLFSRCYGYVHFPTDVLCGALLGLLSALLMLTLFRVTKLDRKLSGRK